jgi:RNA-directed DNA polymerase
MLIIFCVRGVISPLLSNLYLNEVDRMLEKAVDTTRRGKSTNVQYARYADDLVILIDAERRSDWLVNAIDRRLREEFAKLRVAINGGQESDGGSEEGRELCFSGFSVSAHTQLSAERAAILRAQAEEADSAV